MISDPRRLLWHALLAAPLWLALDWLYGSLVLGPSWSSENSSESRQLRYASASFSSTSSEIEDL